MKEHVCQPGQVYVFATNTLGQHTGGDAQTAHKKYGAPWGKAKGRHGSSYGIATRQHVAGHGFVTLALGAIESQVLQFIGHATTCPNTEFFVNRIAAGEKGYPASDIAPMFRDAPANVILPPEWVQIIKGGQGR